MSNPQRAARTILDPMDRISEVLFGLIMVLTFTGSLSVASADRGDVRTMLIGALGCNLAWGIIDGVFYLMGCLSERARVYQALRAAQQAVDPAAARHTIAEALPSAFVQALQPSDFDTLRTRLSQVAPPPERPQLEAGEWLGAFMVFVWVFLTTLPVALPFLFLDNLPQAMRTSNAIAVALLFLCGYAFGRHTGYRPWVGGLAMVLLGSILVGLTIALGG